MGEWLLTECQARERLRRAVSAAGSQRNFARDNGISHTFVNDALHGRRNVSGKMAAAIGLRKIIKYAESDLGSVTKDEER